VPARYRKDLTRKKTTKKIAVADIPTDPTLSGNQVGKAYVKESPDRAEETTTEETLTLDTTALDEAVEQKPFVKITSTMTPGPNAVIPTTGNASSKLVYNGPTQKIYENTAEVAVAREGPAGTEKDTKPFVSILNNKRYSTTNAINTLSGSADVVFNDGNVVIYQITETESTGRYGTAGTEQQTKPFVSISTASSYEATGTMGAGEVGGSNKIYDDGTTVVYEKKVETAAVRSGPAGTDKEVKPFVSITTAKRYSETPDIATPTGSAQVIFNDGNVQAYEVSEPTSVARPGEKSTEQDSQPWGYIIEKTDYTANSSPGDGGGSRLIYDDGTVKMYESSRVDSITANGTTKDKDPQQWGTLSWGGTYSDTEDPGADRSKQVWRKGSFKVFLNETASLDVSGGAVDVDAQNWGKITWTGTYSSSSGGDKSRQIFRLGNKSVYLNETASITPSGGSSDKDPQQWGAINWSGSYSSTPGGDKSRQVYSGPGGSVFLNETASVTPSGSSKDVDSQQWGKITWNGSYSSSSSGDKSRQVYSGPGGNVYLNETASVTPSGGTKEKDSAAWGSVTWNGQYSGSPSGDRYKQVANIGGQSVYLNETASVDPNGGSKEVDPNAWGSITWNGTFGSVSSGTRSQKVAQVGPTSVYKNETPVLSVAGGSFTSAQEKHPLYTTVETSSFATTSILGQGDSRSKQVFALGAERVFENISRVVTGTGTRTYGTMVKFTAPSVLLSLNRTDLMRRDGGIDAIWNPVIQEGFEGFFPAVVTEKYADNAGFSGGSIINFGPTPIKIATPFGNVSIGPTLHGQIHLSWGFKNDKTYYDNSSQINIPATPYTTWRGAGRVLVGYETQPHLSGFITREIHITL
jgi:hypothetical protein